MIDFAKMLEPKEQTCFICAVPFVGVRRLCGEARCEALWKEHVRDVERLYPSRSLPRGAVFKIDFSAVAGADPEASSGS